MIRGHSVTYEHVHCMYSRVKLQGIQRRGKHAARRGQNCRGSARELNRVVRAVSGGSKNNLRIFLFTSRHYLQVFASGEFDN